MLENRPLVLTLSESADYLATTERHLRRLVAERQIAFVKIGRFLRFRVEDLDEYLEANRVAARVSGGRRGGRR